jgi:prepilin-type N-terminal cleavage/methylation domain-containing protein
MRRRRGFTLVEMLVVITIIGVLMALIVPAVWGAVRRARKAQAEAQVNTIAAALASYQSTGRAAPPSRLILHETGFFGTPPDGPDGYYAGMDSGHAPIGGRPGVGPDPTTQEYRDLVARSVAASRTHFPKVNVSPKAFREDVDVPLAPAPQGYYDFNGNGRMDLQPIYLEGHECLAFFLCGVADWERVDDGTWALRGVGGFDANGRNPFRAVPATGADASRVDPYYDVTSEEAVADDDRDGMPGLLDPLGSSSDARYVVYFSASGGTGYDPRDVDLEGEPSAPFTLPSVGDITSPGPNPWCTSDQAGARAPRWLRGQTYQLFSPGLDRKYGPGGTVQAEGESWTYPGDDRTAEEDNVALR